MSSAAGRASTAATGSNADAGVAPGNGDTGAGGSESGSPAASGPVAAGAAAPAPDPGSEPGGPVGTGAAGSGTTVEPPTGPLPDPASAVIAEPVDAASALFDDSAIHTFNIVIASADLAKIDAHPSYEESVQAGLEFNGRSYGPYRVRYKGAGGAFKPPCTEGGAKTGKCSLKLDFNDIDSKARFFGLKKLNLHSMNADSSLLRDRLDYRMYREMGVAAPRAAHARVLINGKSEGLYIAVEQIDGVFARARFSEGGEGNVYKEIWPVHAAAATYVAALETNEDQADVQHMLGFYAAIRQSKAAAERYFDREYMLRYLAVDRVTINDDGVVRFLCSESAIGNNPAPVGNHNYYWYEEPQSGRMWLIPWDLDKSFDATSDVRVFPEWTASAACSCTQHPWYGSQMPVTCDPLFRHIQGSLADYERQVDAFLSGPFAKAHVDALLDGWTRQIRPHVEATAGQNGAPTFEQWQTGVAELRKIVDDARKNRGLVY